MSTMTNLRTYAVSGALLLALSAATTVPVSAQRGRPRAPAPQAAPWMPITVGIRLGYDDQLNGTVLGGQLHIPVIRNGFIELVPNGDVTFINSLKEYEFNADILVSSAGRRGGLYLAAGPAWRNTIFNTQSSTAGRETKAGWSIASPSGTTCERMLAPWLPPVTRTRKIPSSVKGG